MIDDIIKEIEQKYEMRFYGNERIALYAFAGLVWAAATKAQRDAIAENAGADYLWSDEIEDVPLVPFPEVK